MNGYHIPIQAKLFFNKADNSLDSEVYPSLDNLEELKKKLENELWEFINEKRILLEEITAFKAIFSDAKQLTDPAKIFELPAIQNYKKMFQKTI